MDPTCLEFSQHNFGLRKWIQQCSSFWTCFGGRRRHDFGCCSDEVSLRGRMNRGILFCLFFSSVVESGSMFNPCRGRGSFWNDVRSCDSVWFFLVRLSIAGRSMNRGRLSVCFIGRNLWHGLGLCTFWGFWSWVGTVLTENLIWSTWCLRVSPYRRISANEAPAARAEEKVQ